MKILKGGKSTILVLFSLKGSEAQKLMGIFTHVSCELVEPCEHVTKE